MKICFIYPTTPDRTMMANYPPLGILYLSAILKKAGHEVLVFDRYRNFCQNEDLNQVDSLLSASLNEFKPNYVGITATTLLIPDAYRTARIVRLVLPGAKIIAGGCHPTALPEQTLEECPEIDMVCRGEGELTLVEFLEAGSPEGVAGLTFRNSDGSITTNRDRGQIEHLDSLPLPDWGAIDMAFYTAPTVVLIRGLKLRATHILSARGCPFSCDYCMGSRMFPKVRFHSPERVLEELRYLNESLGIQGIYFAEDMFLANRKRAEEICRVLRQDRRLRKIKYAVQMRVDQVKEETFQMLKDSGCEQAEFGFESGSQQILDLMKKKTSVAMNYHAAEMAKKMNMRFLANIIVGYPGERREDLMASLNLLRETKPNATSINRFIPLPGTPIFDELKRSGKLNTLDWSQYHVCNPFHFSEMSSEEFEKCIEEFLNGFNFHNYMQNYILDLMRSDPFSAWKELKKYRPSGRFSYKFLFHCLRKLLLGRNDIYIDPSFI
jgi:anaerobic magnesium-protoporphyrin IX monomethyl ester cyclase